MVEINLTGQKPITYPKFLIEQNYYEGEVIDVGSPFKQKNIFKPEEEQEKIPIKVKINGLDVKASCTNLDSVDEKPECVSFTVFPSTKVSKGSGTIKNSKLFDILTLAKVIDKMAGKEKELSVPEVFVDFLKTNLIGKKVKVNVSRKNINGEDKCYISDIVNFL